MSSDVYKRWFVRKADFDADEDLRVLLKEECDDIEIDWNPGTVICTNTYGSRRSQEDIDTHCIKKRIAFDRWIESDLECQATYRLYRPGPPLVDKVIEVDAIDSMPYIFCESIAGILLKEQMSDKEKLAQIADILRNTDFPCPRINDYRSPRETLNQAEEGEG